MRCPVITGDDRRSTEKPNCHDDQEEGADQVRIATQVFGVEA
jgi:hypothetical protein